MGLIFILVFLSGCRTVREKFVRERRSQEVPVYLTLRDYPEKPTRQVYIDYYLYTRGWLGELEKALIRGISHKRQFYAVSQALMNFEQIIVFFNPEGKEAAASLLADLRQIYSGIKQTPNLSQIRRNALVRSTQRVKREFTAGYPYSKVEKWLD